MSIIPTNATGSSNTRKFNRTAEAKDSIHDKSSAIRSIGRRGNIESVNNCRAAMLATSDNDIAPPPGGKGYVQSWKLCSSKCMRRNIWVTLTVFWSSQLHACCVRDTLQNFKGGYHSHSESECS